MTEYELGVLNAIQASVANPALDGFMAGLTWVLSYEIFWIAVAIILLLIPKTRWMGLAVALGFALESTITQLIIKELVMRPRPFVANPDVTLIVADPGGYSWPSGHTGAAFTLAAAMFASARYERMEGWPRNLWIPFTVFAVLVGFSRMYVYVHYPTDVLGGLLFGLFFGWLGAWISFAIHRAVRRRTQNSPGS